MLEDRLSGLTLIYIHTEINPSIDQILNHFASVNRRLELIQFFFFNSQNMQYGLELKV